MGVDLTKVELINPLASFRLIARFVLEIAHFVCNRATTIEDEKL